MTNFQLHKIFQVSGDEFLLSGEAPVHKDFSTNYPGAYLTPKKAIGMLGVAKR
jgi:hypothetical protein